MHLTYVCCCPCCYQLPQVFSFVVYDMIEQILVRRGIKPTVPVRLAYRTLYVIVCAFVACLLPFFGDIMVSTRRVCMQAEQY